MIGCAVGLEDSRGRGKWTIAKLLSLVCFAVALGLLTASLFGASARSTTTQAMLPHR
jgi:hypothetical protein